MAFSFETKQRWQHNKPVNCKATLTFSQTRSGKPQIQVLMEDEYGNRQYSWSSLDSDRAEGILSNRLRPFINSVCGTSMTPETLITRASLMSNLAQKNESGETLRELLNGHTIDMSVITTVVSREDGNARVRVISFLTPSERSETQAIQAASSLNQQAQPKVADNVSDQVQDF